MESLLYLWCLWLAGSPLWSKERNEAIVVQMGVSLVLQCRPPAGLPPPVIFWMDNSESFSCVHMNFTFSRAIPNKYALLDPQKHSFSPRPSDFQRLPLDKRVSQALNGDLYFSNVLPEDSRPDYICYARFPHTQTIQQKQPISVTVLNSKSRRWIQLQLTVFQDSNVTWVKLTLFSSFLLFWCAKL